MARFVDPLPAEKHRELVHPIKGLLACGARKAGGAMKLLVSHCCLVEVAVREEHSCIEIAPRGEGARVKAGEPGRVPVGGLARELEGQLAGPHSRGDLVGAQQVGQLQQVGRPVGTRGPIKRAEVLERQANTVLGAATSIEGGQLLCCQGLSLLP